MRPRYSDSLVRIVHEAVAREDLHKLNEISEYAECKKSTARIILNRLIVRDFLRLEENGDYFAENKMLNMSLMDIDSFNPIQNIFGKYLGIRSFPYCFFTTCFYRIFTEENPFDKKDEQKTEAEEQLDRLRLLIDELTAYKMTLQRIEDKLDTILTMSIKTEIIAGDK